MKMTLPTMLQCTATAYCRPKTLSRFIISVIYILEHMSLVRRPCAVTRCDSLLLTHADTSVWSLREGPMI